MFIDTQSIYFIQAKFAHTKWCEAQRKKPSLINKTTKGVQDRINKVIPEKIHQAVTAAIKHFIKAVLFGAGITTFSRLGKDSLEETEEFVKRRIGFYSSSSAAEGAITGFGGFLAGMADFPLWLSIKMKLLFEVAQAYSMDVREYQERVYMLYIFQLTFSSQKSRAEIFRKLENWEEEKENLPQDLNDFDWRTFQLEYRDHIDLAKLIQLIPGIGAVAGAYINHRYTRRLGENAMQAYRLRFPEFGK
jgi:hypothetical protein